MSQSSAVRSKNYRKRKNEYIKNCRQTLQNIKLLSVDALEFKPATLTWPQQKEEKNDGK